MVFKKKALAMALAMLAGFAATGTAQAQNIYAGLAYTRYNFEGSGSVGDIKPTAATFKLGYLVNRYFAVEGRLATSLSSDSQTVSGVKLDGKVDSHAGIFAKGILPLNDTFSAYGLIGYNDLKLAVSGRQGNQSASASGSNNGSSYGVGLDVALTKEISLNAEWARHFSDVTSMSFGVAYKF